MQPAVLTRSSLLEYEGVVMGKRVTALLEDGTWQTLDCALNALPLSRRDTVINRNLPVQKLIDYMGVLGTKEEIDGVVQVLDVMDDPAMRGYMDQLRLNAGSARELTGIEWGSSISDRPIIPLSKGVGVLITSCIIPLDPKESSSLADREKSLTRKLAIKESYLSQTDVTAVFVFEDEEALPHLMDAIKAVPHAAHKFGIEGDRGVLPKGEQIRVPLSLLVSVMKELGGALTLPVCHLNFEFELTGEGVGFLKGQGSGEDTTEEAPYDGLRAKAAMQRWGYFSLLREQGFLAVHRTSDWLLSLSVDDYERIHVDKG